MGSLTSIAQSGLATASLRFTVSSNNVANGLTGGFAPASVSATAQPDGGVSGQIVPDTSGAIGAQLSGTLAALASQPSDTDLGQETVSQISAAAAYRANLASLRAAETVDQALFSIRS